MKTDIIRIARSGWNVVSEVPGWPDAPLRRRLRRALPVLIPFLAVLAVLADQAIRVEPDRAEHRNAHRNLLRLEDETSQMAVQYTDEQAAALKVQAGALTDCILPTPEAAADWLESLVNSIGAEGWNASFHRYEAEFHDDDLDSPVGFVPVLGRLVPAPGNDDRIRSLIGILELFGSSEKRINLTRMVIRADEPGRPEVEINLQIPYLLFGEKAAQ